MAAPPTDPLEWLPKVISEMVGQTCRFAAAPGRAPPTISEMTFGNRARSRSCDWDRLSENLSASFFELECTADDLNLNLNYFISPAISRGG
jgi:hypothetical protein